MSKFKPGQSGTPAGRPKGTGEVALGRKAIQDDLPAIIDAMVKQARQRLAQVAKAMAEIAGGRN